MKEPESRHPHTQATEKKKGPFLTGPKRHHFLPRFYLEGFCKGGGLALFDREKNEVRQQTPLNTGIIGHFYTLKDTEGRKRFELEDFLSGYESKASQSIPKLAAGQPLTPEERAQLSIFIALAAFRTPDAIESIKLATADVYGDMVKSTFKNVDQVKEIIRKKEGDQFTEDELDREARETIDFVQGNGYQVVTDHKWAVGTAITVGLGIARTLRGRNWLVLHPDRDAKSFITTDAPVHLGTVSQIAPSWFGLGYGNRDAMVTFPLTQSCALVLSGDNGKFEHRLISEKDVRAINLIMANSCQRYVIGRDERLVRSLANDLRLPFYKWQPKMQRS